MLNSDSAMSADIGLVMCDITDLQCRIGDVSFVHTSRKANSIIHNLSKLVLSIIEDVFRMKSYPPYMERIKNSEYYRSTSLNERILPSKATLGRFLNQQNPKNVLLSPI
ncbi:hypothetical protein Ddye_000366 [Dipteronia dyeriana]|uniref:Uncharacterized protein n=1 Tax=Dipteronia dyeriana TaxID=168575 RepID=A0AAD9XLZ1_9ROSI|nr:hypothetical protein Ddye_000366 [Dipteronia dyeriana]